MNAKQILTLIAEFECINENRSEKDFAKWLYNKHFHIQNETDISKYRMVSYLIQRVSRLGKIFGKNALRGTDIYSIDDFTAINIVYNNNGISKNKLYTEAVFEISNGTQIIRRLIECDLITEKKNEKDKRVKNLYITNKGTIQRNMAFEALQKEIQFKVSMLSKQEVDDLYSILTKMNLALSLHFNPKGIQ
jgi:DNA-binding MarR family transcriptional regulator